LKQDAEELSLGKRSLKKALRVVLILLMVVAAVTAVVIGKIGGKQSAKTLFEQSPNAVLEAVQKKVQEVSSTLPVIIGDTRFDSISLDSEEKIIHYRYTLLGIENKINENEKQTIEITIRKSLLADMCKQKKFTKGFRSRFSYLDSNGKLIADTIVSEKNC
jgi:hypothetical protein